VSFFPDGKTLVSAGQDSFVKFWTIPNGALFRSVIATDAVPVQVAVSPEWKVDCRSDARRPCSKSGRQMAKRTVTLVGHSGTVNGVAFTADGAKLVSVSQDHTTRIWSVAEAKLLRTFSDTDAMNEVAIPAAAASWPGDGRRSAVCW
jgi:WD40 repeat protein